MAAPTGAFNSRVGAFGNVDRRCGDGGRSHDFDFEVGNWNVVHHVKHNGAWIDEHGVRQFSQPRECSRLR